MEYWLGTTINANGQFGLVTDYDPKTDEYTYVNADVTHGRIARADAVRMDFPVAREVAAVLRDSNYQAGHAFLSIEDGWDIVSGIYDPAYPEVESTGCPYCDWEREYSAAEAYDDTHAMSKLRKVIPPSCNHWPRLYFGNEPHKANFIENDGRDLARVDPAPENPNEDMGDELIWDPTSHTYVRAEQERPLIEHSPESWNLDPQNKTVRPKNPEFEGVYAAATHVCPNCGTENEYAYDTCPGCGQRVEMGDPTTAVQPGHPNDSAYLEVDPRSPYGRDDSFPGMISKRTAGVKGDMRNFAHYREELAYHDANPASLDECPECGDPMVDTLDHKEAQCHTCGHRQPVVYNVSKTAEKTSFVAALAPLAGVIAPLMQSAFGKLNGNEESFTHTGGADGDDVGLATDDTGENDTPDAGNQGFTEQHGDSPELLKAINDIGGTEGHDVLDKIRQHMPKIHEYANDDSRSADEDSDMVDLDHLLSISVPGYTKQHSSSYHESVRRPKMCPYHTNLLDYAQALGDPALALKSLGGMMYDSQSCLGGYELLNKNENPIKCKYKPEMLMPDYWEKKEQEAEQRRLEREQRQLLNPDPLTPQDMVQQEIEAQPVTDVTQPSNEVTLTPEAVEQMKEEPNVVPETDAIELPQDYDPEAYWEADDIPDVMPPSQPAQEIQPEPMVAPDYQVPQGYQLVPVAAKTAFAPEAPAEDVQQAANLHQQVAPEGPSNDSFAQLRDLLLQEGMNEERVNNVINAMVTDHLPHQAKTADFTPDQTTQAELQGHMDPVTQDVEHADETSVATHVTDTDGEPLKVGSTYDMMNPSVDPLPETVKITRVNPYYVEFEVLNDMVTFENRVHAKEIATEGIKFQKHVATPNAAGQTADSAPANRTGDVGPDVTDLSTGRSSNLDWLREGSLDSAIGDDPLGWLKDGMPKEAGRSFSPREQRELIGESGNARNLSKLDLRGTHYEAPSYELGTGAVPPDDDFLFI